MDMTTLESVLMMLLVLDALALAGIVLLQQGKGADAGAAFGAGAANTMFGSGGSASFLVKVTAWLAVGFFVIAFSLAWIAQEKATGMRDLGLPQTMPLEIADGEVGDSTPEISVTEEPTGEAGEETGDNDGAPAIPDV